MKYLKIEKVNCLHNLPASNSAYITLVNQEINNFSAGEKAEQF